MSISDKLQTIAENESKVFDSGYSQSEREWWDNILDKGTRTNGEYVFYHWRQEYIRPPYKFTPTSRPIAMFSNCSNLKKVEKDYFDLSNCPVTTSTNGNYTVFSTCDNLEEIEDIGLPAGDYVYTYRYCYKLHTIEKIRTHKDAVFSSPFLNCYKLANITIEGEIGNNISFAQSSELTIESLKSIIVALYDYSAEGITKTLTLHATAEARLTEDDRKAITDKGWTIAV